MGFQWKVAFFLYVSAVLMFIVTIAVGSWVRFQVCARSSIILHHAQVSSLPDVLCLFNFVATNTLFPPLVGIQLQPHRGICRHHDHRASHVAREPGVLLAFLKSHF